MKLQPVNEHNPYILFSGILSISETGIYEEGDTATLTCSFSYYSDVTVDIQIVSRSSTFENPDTYTTTNLATSGT